LTQLIRGTTFKISTKLGTCSTIALNGFRLGEMPERTGSLRRPIQICEYCFLLTNPKLKVLILTMEVIYKKYLN